MKKVFLFALLFTLSVNIHAQEEVNLLTSRSTALERNYLRPSMTRLFIIDGTSTSVAAVKKLMEIPDAMFDQNTVSNNVFTIENIPDKKEERDSVVKAKIASIILNQKIGSQIMKNWFPTFTNENGYGIEKLIERGQFAATDNDILAANASARQTALNELGEKLIDRSYATFYLIKDGSYTDKKGKLHESVSIVPYVYKLDFNKEVMNNFYNNFYMKSNGLDECEFPMLYVVNAKSGVSSDPADIDENDYEDMKTIIGKKVADFQVKTPVISTGPVRAKIGLKEGLRVDKRFAAMEYRQDKNGNEYAKRIASLRVNKVADNNAIATGNTLEQTSFYYIKGRPVHEGMTLVSNPDFGIVADVQYNLGGFNASIGYRFARLLNAFPGFIVYLNAGLANDEDGKFMKVMAFTDKNKNPSDWEDWENVPVLRAGLGIAKEFYFARNFCLTPSIGAGVLYPIGAKEINLENNTVDTETSSLDSYYFDGSLKFGYMATREVQVFVEAGYSLNILGDQFKFMRDLYAANESKEAKDPSKIRIGAGVKVSF